MAGLEKDGERETSECRHREEETDEEEEMDEERKTQPGEAAFP